MKFTDSELFSIFFQVTKAINYLHNGLKMCHRDIKPHNIMFGECNQVLVTDFGTSKIIDSDDNDRTSTGLQGTVNYMSPEVAKKRKRNDGYEYDPFKADMWSLGVTVY